MSSREELLAAVRGSRNLNEAARALNVSRRTLQNRMREYGLPRGRGGRPKRALAYHKTGTLETAVGIAALIGGGVLLTRWLARRSQKLA